MSPAEQRARAPAHRERSSSFAGRASNNAAMPAPQRPPDAAAARGRTERNGRRQRQISHSRTLPPQHVLEKAWRQMTQAAEAWVPADTNHGVDQQLMMQRCDDASCWHEDVAGKAAAAARDNAAGDQGGDVSSESAAAGAEHAAEDDDWYCQDDQLVHCEPDSSANDADNCIVSGDEESAAGSGLKGRSIGGFQKGRSVDGFQKGRSMVVILLTLLVHHFALLTILVAALLAIHEIFGKVGCSGHLIKLVFHQACA